MADPKFTPPPHAIKARWPPTAPTLAPDRFKEFKELYERAHPRALTVEIATAWADVIVSSERYAGVIPEFARAVNLDEDVEIALLTSVPAEGEDGEPVELVAAGYKRIPLPRHTLWWERVLKSGRLITNARELQSSTALEDWPETVGTGFTVAGRPGWWKYGLGGCVICPKGQHLCFMAGSFQLNIESERDR